MQSDSTTFFGGIGGNEIAYIGPGSENEFVMPPMTHLVILIVNIYYIL